MFAKGETIIAWFEQLAPKQYAIPEDKIGLQLGSLNKEIRHVMIALDVTDEVVEEAIARDVNLIIAHHAIIYRPLSSLKTDTPAGRLYEKLIKHDIAVYIAHTNLDVAEHGVNDLLADAIELQDVTCLEEVHTERLKKLVVFVPQAHHEHVLQALFHAGAGHIGNYSHCSFNLNGTGTYLPQEGAQPYAGKQGKLSREEEVRIETVLPEALQKKVVQAMLKAHPYEEVAYDLYPMDLKGRSFGLGRVGRLPKQQSLAQLVERVKQAYDVETVRVVGDLHRIVRKAAVLGGSGSRYVRHALFAGADVLITGDIDYHTAHDALAAGLAIIDPGHNVEKILKQHVADYLQKKLHDKQSETQVFASDVNTEPFIFV